MSISFKTPYQEQERQQISFDGVSLTDQSFKQECDIGFIIENFVKTGQLPESSMSFVDCTTVQKFEDAMQIVAEAKSNFEQLPSSIRDEFKTVTNYLSYISDPANLKDSYERGLIDKTSVNLEDVYPELYQPTVQEPIVPDVVTPVVPEPVVPEQGVQVQPEQIVQS